MMSNELKSIVIVDNCNHTILAVTVTVSEFSVEKFCMHNWLSIVLVLCFKDYHAVNKSECTHSDYSVRPHI